MRWLSSIQASSMKIYLVFVTIYTILRGGAHITGFKTAFTGIINSYARELGILKDKDANFNGADVRNGMTAVVSVKHPDPRFRGSDKDKT